MITANFSALVNGLVANFTDTSIPEMNTIPITSWLWDFGDPTTTNDNSTLNTPTYTYPNPGNYTVSLTTGVGTNCANTATTQLVISSVVPNFSTTAPQCAGNAVSFTDLTTHSANATLNSWSWNFGDNTSSTLQIGRAHV